MKIISLLFATAAFLAAAVVAAGYTLNAVVVLSITCAACVVGLFVHDYSRFRHRVQLKAHRSRRARPSRRVKAEQLPEMNRPVTIQSAATVG